MTEPTINYLLSWPTARKRDAFSSKRVRTLFEKLVKKECKKRGWKLISWIAMMHGVESLHIQVTPRNSAHEVVSRLKRATSVMRQEIPGLRTWPSMWTNDYIAFTDMHDLEYFDKIRAMFDKVKTSY